LPPPFGAVRWASLPSRLGYRATYEPKHGIIQSATKFYLNGLYLRSFPSFVSFCIKNTLFWFWPKSCLLATFFVTRSNFSKPLFCVVFHFLIQNNACLFRLYLFVQTDVFCHFYHCFVLTVVFTPTLFGFYSCPFVFRLI
jgi:hypothetical protein